MVKTMIKQIKIYQKGIAIAAEKSAVTTRWKIKKIRQFSDVTVTLDDSLIKDVKGWHFIDESNKVVVKYFHGATISQMKWHVKPTTEQNAKDIILHCGTNDTNDDSEPQNIAKDIAKVAKSIKKNCNSNVTVSCIVPRYGELNEKVRSVNRLLQICCRNMNIVLLAMRI